MLTDFQNSVTAGKGVKFATNEHYPPHLKYVVTLP